MSESRQNMEQRLREEGRLSEFYERVEELRSQGATGTAAHSQARLEFEPIEDDDKLLSAGDFLGKSASASEVIRWVAASIGDMSLKAVDSPSPAAWKLLTNVRRNCSNETYFWCNFFERLLPSRAMIQERHETVDDRSWWMNMQDMAWAITSWQRTDDRYADCPHDGRCVGEQPCTTETSDQAARFSAQLAVEWCADNLGVGDSMPPNTTTANLRTWAQQNAATESDFFKLFGKLLATREAVQDLVSNEAELDRLLEEMRDGSVGSHHGWQANGPELDAPKMHPGLAKRKAAGQLFDVTSCRWV